MSALDKYHKAEAAFDTARAMRSTKRIALLKEFTDKLDADLNAEFGASIDAAAEALHAARNEWYAEMVRQAETTGDPEGTVYVERIKKRFSWDKKTPRRGVVEIMRPDTVIPDNVGNPSIGTKFLRLLKADGSKGRAIVKHYENANWKKGAE